MTTKYPPLYPTPYTPEEIVGRENMDTFYKFLTIAFASTNGGEYPNKRLDKEIGKDLRPAIAETLERLRENGFYPREAVNGIIKWGIVTKSKSQFLFSDGLADLQKMSTEELMRMGRNGYLEVVKNARVDGVGDYEMYEA